MAISLEFICPKCPSNRLEVVRTDVMITTPFNGVDLDKDGYYELNYDFSREEQNDGYIECFQCADCGHLLKRRGQKITDEDELVGWLKSRPYNRQNKEAPHA